MRAKLIAFFGLALVPIAAIAQTPPGACGTMTNANVFITFAAPGGTCNEMNPTNCPSDQEIVFVAGASSFGTGGYSFSCANHSFTWSIEGQTKSGQSVGHTFTSQGQKTVNLSISNGNQTFPVSATLVVVARCGQMSNGNVSFGYSGSTSGCSPNGVCLATEDIAFRVDSAGYDFGCLPHSFSWDFGDGSTAGGQQASHRFDGPGTRTVSVTISNGSQAFTLSGAITLASCLPLTIQPASLPTGRVGENYSIRIAAAGSASPPQFTLAAGSVPPGMNLSADGLLFGSPTIAGAYTFTVMAAAANSCPEEKQYEVVIQRACQPITINPSRMPRAQFGASYAVQLSATGGTSPYAYLLGGTLPPGLTLRGDTISGVATTLGTFPFTAYLADVDSCVGNRAYEIEVTLSSGCPLMVPGTNIAVQYRGAKSGCKPGAVCQAGETIDFTVSTVGYDLACGPHAVTWAFGDDAVAGGLAASHSYANGGTYRVKLTIANAQQVAVMETDVLVGSGRRRSVRR